MRRPIFIYDKNKVGGGEHLFLRRAQSAKRLGLDPVVITIPGAMDEAYRRTARLIHLPKPLLSKCGLTASLGERVADQLVDGLIESKAGRIALLLHGQERSLRRRSLPAMVRELMGEW